MPIFFSSYALPLRFVATEGAQAAGSCNQEAEMLLRFTKLWDEINPFSEEIVGQTGYVRGGPRISSCEYAACACLRARHCPGTHARTRTPHNVPGLCETSARSC